MREVRGQCRYSELKHLLVYRHAEENDVVITNATSWRTALEEALLCGNSSRCVFYITTQGQFFHTLQSTKFSNPPFLPEGYFPADQVYQTSKLNLQTFSGDSEKPTKQLSSPSISVLTRRARGAGHRNAEQPCFEEGDSGREHANDMA